MTVQIKEPFNEQYTLIIDSDMQAVDMHITTTTQMRWDFTVVKVTDHSLEIRLILLDHILLETNNPMVKEVAQVSQVFSRMYNELHVTIDKEGMISQIHNLDVIQQKWEQTKKELLKSVEHSPDIKGIIQINDELFAAPDKIKQAIQANEFFTTYFSYVYGKELPYIEKGIVKPNFFNSANVQWDLSITSVDLQLIHLEMKPSFLLSSGFYNKAYGQFAEKIDISKLFTQMKETGKYQIESGSGRLAEAIIHRKEEAAANLYTKVSYHFMSEEKYKEKLKNKSQKYTEEIKAVQEHISTQNVKEVNGKKYTKEQWESFERKQWEIYAKKHNISGFDDKNQKDLPSGRFLADD